MIKIMQIKMSYISARRKYFETSLCITDSTDMQMLHVPNPGHNNTSCASDGTFLSVLF